MQKGPIFKATLPKSGSPVAETIMVARNAEQGFGARLFLKLLKRLYRQIEALGVAEICKITGDEDHVGLQSHQSNTQGFELTQVMVIRNDCSPKQSLEESPRLVLRVRMLNVEVGDMGDSEHARSPSVKLQAAEPQIPRDARSFGFLDGTALTDL